MKDRTLAYCALGLSAVALAYAVWVHQLGSEELARRALERRERALVAHWAPRFAEFYAGFGGTGTFPKSPVTLEELFDPMLDTLNEMGGSPETGTNSASP